LSARFAGFTPHTAMHYQGTELDLFANAKRWKRYWSDSIRPYLSGAVLEVGAGLGANTELLRENSQSRWVCLEPDPDLVAAMRRRFHDGAVRQCPEVRIGTLADLSPHERFDAIVYIDVLEHLDDDRGELERASRHLNAGGRLIVLSPAHEWLFSPFDAAIGHRRRYSRRSLATAAPADMNRIVLRYLDAAGLPTSLMNRLLFRQSMPTAKQLRFWDRFLVPISRRLDPLLAYRVGKSVLGVWVR